MALKGFFFPNKEKSDSPGGPTRSPRNSAGAKSKKALGCDSCGLYKTCLSPRMEPTGKGRLGVLFVAEASGQIEDEQGIQLIGDTGQLIRDKLAKHGVNLDRDFWKTNAICCRPPSNRTPTKKEIACCRSRLLATIAEYKPKMIILMGDVALESFYVGRGFGDLGIGLWRDRCIPDRETGAWIVPLYHGAYLLRNRGNKIIESIFNRDFEQAVSWLSKDAPKFQDFEKDVILVTDYAEIIDLLYQINQEKEISNFVFDYETTGLRPYRAGHKIASISFYWKGKAYSFPYQYTDAWSADQFNQIRQEWKKILSNPKIRKSGQNIKFEDKWSRNIVGVTPDGWLRDTMINSHLLDERKGAAGLKMQAYWRWGFWGYDNKVKPFLDSKGAEFNRVMEAPLNDLLLYGGLDSRLEYELDKEQTQELKMKENLSVKKAVDLYFDGTLALCEMEEFGIHINEPYFEKEKKEIQLILDRLEKRLNSSKEAGMFKEHYGSLPDFGSNTDISNLLYNVLSIKPKKTTIKNNPSVDEEALEGLKETVSFIKPLLQKRRFEKISGTYIAQFIRESVNGVVYPNTNLQAARTGRPSTDSPNMKNIPKRDEEAKEIVRSGIIPSPGHKIMETDYNGAEVRAAACLTTDPALVAYINDKTTDMHRDQAVELFILSPDQMLPKKSNGLWNDNVNKIRFVSKNSWTFAQFYGSWYLPCASSLWDEIPKLKLGDGMPVSEHLSDEGIRRIDDFTEHVKACERKLWKRFSVFKEWQEEQVEFYCRMGYVENPFGFRRRGLHKRNEILNTPIQGTAYCWMLWSIARIIEIRKKEGWKTKIPGEIYDALWTDLYPPEGKRVREVYNQVMTKDIRRAFGWIIVPLEVEHEEAKVGEPWYSIKRVED